LLSFKRPSPSGNTLTSSCNAHAKQSCDHGVHCSLIYPRQRICSNKP
jgi:hypothetical protein